MNGLRADLAELAQIDAATPQNVEIVICPPATLLGQITARHIALGGQDCRAEASGAFTGDLSAPMLRDAGARYVILGHSERRQLHSETDALIHAKLVAAQAAHLTPILCLGESEVERDAGRTLAIVTSQLSQGLTDSPDVVIAYEPVWAVGTGRVPLPDQIAEVHHAIRAQLTTRFGTSGLAIRILYGGSVKATNAAEIFAVPEVDGALVGGASLKASDFIPIVQRLAAAPT